MNRAGAWIWLTVFIGVLAWSAVDPAHRLTWFMEVLPALVALVVIVLTRRRYPLTPMLYVLILLHAVILMIGGHYTYAEVPLFDRLSDLLGWQRNNYDKLGHFAQGFVPAMVAREILIRQAVINGRGWMNFLIVCFALAVSAFYELIEWWAALVSGDAADAFLGTQGYVWDTQSDMLLAMLGAITALLSLARRHDAQLQKLATRPV